MYVHVNHAFWDNPCVCLYEFALIICEFVYVCTCGVVLQLHVNFNWGVYLQLLIYRYIYMRNKFSIYSDTVSVVHKRVVLVLGSATLILSSL